MAAPPPLPQPPPTCGRARRLPWATRRSLALLAVAVLACVSSGVAAAALERARRRAVLPLVTSPHAPPPRRRLQPAVTHARAQAAQRAPALAVFSLPVYKCEACALDLVRNVLGFAPGGAVVVHINGLPQRHLAAERVRAAPLRAAGALVNSARLAVRKGGPSLLQAHASNFLYARSALGDRFQYFCMLASNALLVRPGIIAAMQGRSGTRHHVHNASRPDAEPHTWAAKWRDDATLQLLRRQFGVAHLPVRKQFHEGAFYRREAFAPLAKVIHEGRVGAHGPAGMDDRRPRWKYPAEEIYPATLLQRAVAEGPGEPVPDTFIQMDWEHDLETSVAGLSACDARPAPCFGVKRVALDARDAVRVHVRTQRLELYLVSAARRRHAAQAAAAIAAAWPEDEW